MHYVFLSLLLRQLEKLLVVFLSPSFGCIVVIGEIWVFFFIITFFFLQVSKRI